MIKKAQQISESMPLAILLTISGGFMDAYSYMCRGHVFANAQTGNILLFGVNLSKGDFASATRYLLPVLAFTLGIVAAEVARYRISREGRIHWRQVSVLIEAMILFCVAFIPQEMNLLANSLTSFACGAQVETFRKVNGTGVATTMCIGNLRAATQALCDYGFTRDKYAIRNGILYFCLILLFALGAVLGNFCVEMWWEKSIFVSSLLLLCGFLLMRIDQKE